MIMRIALQADTRSGYPFGDPVGPVDGRVPRVFDAVRVQGETDRVRQDLENPGRGLPQPDFHDVVGDGFKETLSFWQHDEARREERRRARRKDVKTNLPIIPSRER